MLLISSSWSGIAVNTSLKKAFIPSGTDSVPTEAMLSTPPDFQQAIIASQGPESLLKKAVRGDRKGKLSLVLYVFAIALAFAFDWISLGIYVLVALVWLVPDKLIEHVLASE